MLARYRIVRGRRASDDPLPDGTRLDTRRHTRSVLRPDARLVDALLVDPTDDARAEAFAEAYLRMLAERFAADPAPFEELAELAKSNDVYLGCSCPTKRQPDVMRCHTVLALRFFAQRFEDLDVRFPDA